MVGIYSKMSFNAVFTQMLIFYHSTIYFTLNLIRSDCKSFHVKYCYIYIIIFLAMNVDAGLI